MYNERIIQRNQLFQQNNSQKYFQRKRQNIAVSLRKASRNQQYNLKRKIHPIPNQGSTRFNFSTDYLTPLLKSSEPKLASQTLKSQDRLRILLEILNTSSNSQILADSIEILRILVSIDQQEPYEEILNSGVINRLMSFIKVEQLQEKALWCLTNMVCGPPKISEELEYLGLLDEVLINLGKNPQIDTLCLWTIGNISGNCLKSRDNVIQSQIPAVLARMIIQRDQKNRGNFLTIGWIFQNLTKGKPEPPESFSFMVLQAFACLITFSQESYSDCLWAICNLTNNSYRCVQKCQQLNFIKFLLSQIANSEKNNSIPAIRAIGNIINLSDELSVEMVNQGLLQKLFIKLNTRQRVTLRQTLWSISNLFATTIQVAKMMVQHQIMLKIFQNLRNPDIEIQKEALWCLFNSSHHFSIDDIVKFDQMGLFQQVTELLNVVDLRILDKILDCLGVMLRKGAEWEFNKVAQILEETGGVQQIQKLQSHPCQSLYQKVVSILQLFFEGEEVLNEALLNPPLVYSI